MLKESGHLVPHMTKTKKGEEVELDAEPRTIPTPFGDRGGVVIEPWLTDQWYVDAEKLAERSDCGGEVHGDDRDCPEDLGKDVLQLDGEYPAVVRVSPAVVGAPNSGLV